MDPTQHGLVWLARETRDNALSETRKSPIALFKRARDEKGPFLELMQDASAKSAPTSRTCDDD